MTYLILGSCALLIFVFFRTHDANVKIASLLGSVVLFSGGFYFISQPWIAPMHIPLYCSLLSFALFYNEDRRAIMRKYPIKKWTLFLFLSFLASGFFGDEGQIYGCYTATRFFLDSYGFFLVAFVLGSKCEYEDLANLLFWPVIFYCAFGFLEAAMGYNYIYSWMIDSFPLYEGYLGKTSSVMNYFDTWRIRTSITTMHPTTLGALLTVFFIFYLPMVKRKEAKFLCLFGILCVMIFLSGSRTAWVCSALYGLYYFIKGRKLMVKMCFYAMCVGAAFYVGNEILSSFTAEDRGSSIDMRQRNLLVCYLAFVDKPLTGHGFNYIGTLIERNDNGFAVDGAMESVVYNTMVEQGILGMATYLLFVFANLFAFRKLRKRDEDVADIGAGITVMITLFSLMSGTLGNLHSMAYIMQGTCLGILCYKKDPEEDEESAS